ncbi:MAG: response regulator transcription factor [Candidatus Fermentibacteraceae bacterium]|nr:response regulator transcription factor [Candidatus Fermentibacteraceae bacterium]
MRILIVDDDLSTRSTLASILIKCGHDVEMVSSGEEAWTVISQPDAPRLILLDWLMPGMNGLDLLKRIRSMDGDNPFYIIMLTVKDNKEDIVEGLDCGTDDYITKPFYPEELRARINAGQRIIEMQSRLMSQANDLRNSLDHIKTLQGILPICSFCKKVRNDKNYWHQLEDYISTHTEAMVTHSICPECMQIHYPEIHQRMARKRAEEEENIN